MRFNENLEMDWVWSYSFAREQPILVPEQAVYYDTFRYPAGTLFVAESSNGCATGACPEEAIFFGLHWSEMPYCTPGTASPGHRDGT